MSKMSFEHWFENASLEQQRPFILYQRVFLSEASEALGNQKTMQINLPNSPPRQTHVEAARHHYPALNFRFSLQTAGK